MSDFIHIADKLDKQDEIFREHGKTLGEISATLSAFRHELIGNGQPGRLGKVETKVSTLEEHSAHLKGWIAGAYATAAAVGGGIAWMVHLIRTGKP